MLEAACELHSFHNLAVRLEIKKLRSQGTATYVYSRSLENGQARYSNPFNNFIQSFVDITLRLLVIVQGRGSWKSIPISGSKFMVTGDNLPMHVYYP